MSEILRVLLLEDRAADAELIVRAIKAGGYEVTAKRAATREEFLHGLAEFEPNLVIADYYLPSFGALEALQLARKLGPPVPFIVATGAIDEDTATACIRAGVDDYVIKDRLVRLPAAIKAVLERHRVRTARRQAEEGFRSLVENAIQGLVIFQGTRIAYVNQAFARITGFTVEELLAFPWPRVQELVHPEDRAMVWGRFRDRAAGKEVTPQYEFRLLHRDGSTRWVEMCASTMSLEGQPAIQAALLDVTERRRAEQALRESGAFLRRVIDAVPSMIFVKDWEGRFILGNAALLRCYGTTSDEMLGKTDADFNPKAEEVAHFQRDDREVMTTRCEKLVPEEEVTHADGQVRWFSTIKVPLLNEDGTCDKVLGVATDITERKRAEEALRASQERFHRAFDVCPEGIAITRLADGRVVEVNDSFAAIAGRPRETVLGRTADEIGNWVDEHDRTRLTTTLRESGQCRDFETRLRRADGSVFLGKISARLIELDGEPCIIASLRDVSELQQLRAEAERLRQELARLRQVP